jgi:DNA polymerase-4
MDLDQFVAAVEVRRHPELRGRPVIVGGEGDPTRRGVVSTASYEARACGVHSGMPLRTAARRCPGAVFLPVDRAAYEAASAAVMGVLARTGAVVEVLGWDEAFLRVHTDDPEGFARALQAQVRAETGLACTVGIGRNRLQAKMATGLGKPAGVARLTHDTWSAVLGDRPIDVLWGIGPATARRLAALGIVTVDQLAAADPRRLASALGPVHGPWLISLARGQSSARVRSTPVPARSRGRERTYQRDLDDWGEVTGEVARLARELAGELAGSRRPVDRVVVTVRFAPFVTRSHGHRLPTPALDAASIEAGALAALTRFTAHGPVRMLGVRVEFTPGASSRRHAPPRAAAPGPARLSPG